MKTKLTIACVLAASVSTAAWAADTGVTAFQKSFLAGKAGWSDVLATAKQEGKVNLYYWGGSNVINVWMDKVVKPEMAKMGITFNPVRITATKDAVDLVLAEKSAGKGLGQGSVDLIWVNGNNYATLKQQDALFGSFAELLPNAKNLDFNAKDPRSQLNLNDFGVANNATEMPWSGEQYVCAYNSKRMKADEVPHSFAGLTAFLKAHPGKFTYVKPPNYEGDTFVEEAVYAHNPDGNGAAPFQKPLSAMPATELARLIAPGMEYLKSLQPMLHNGARYPKNSTELTGLFLNGQVDMMCKFGLYAVATGLATGSYPEGAKQFIFPAGLMIKNKNYLVIPSNAPNPAAALVVANWMTSVSSQASKLKMTGMPSGIDSWKLTEAEAKQIADASPGLVGVTQKELDANAAPDTNGTLVDAIQQTWVRYIEQGSDKPISEIVAAVYKDLKAKQK